MLESAKEALWKAKARELRLQNEMEIRARKEQEEQEAGWKRRLHESDWIMKGVKKVKDNNVENVIREGLQRKEDSVVKRFRLKLKTSKNKVTKTEEEQESTPGDDGKNFKESVIEFLAKRLESKEHAIGEKQRRAEELQREKEIAGRGKFLVKNSYHIRMLQQVYAILGRPRMPRHDLSAEAMMDGFVKDSEEMKAVENDMRYAHLRNYKGKSIDCGGGLWW
jgi:hypothetical protein